MSRLRVKGKCIIAVISCGSYTTGVILWHTGGNYDGNQNVWAEEISEYAANIDDIFIDYKYPDEPGLYVWEGEIEPIYDDAPGYYGEWRPATQEDISVLVRE